MEGSCPVTNEYTLACDSMDPNKTIGIMNKKGTRPVTIEGNLACYSVTGNKGTEIQATRKDVQ